MGQLAAHIEAIVAGLRRNGLRTSVAPLLVDLLTVLRGHRNLVVNLGLPWRGLYEYAGYLQALNNFRVLIGQWLLDGGPRSEQLLLSRRGFRAGGLAHAGRRHAADRHVRALGSLARPRTSPCSGRSRSRRWSGPCSGGRGCGGETGGTGGRRRRMCYIEAHAYDSRVFFWLLLVLQPLRRPRDLSVHRTHANELPQNRRTPRRFFYVRIPDPEPREEHPVNATANAASDTWYAHPVDKTSQTDDERIKDITVLPPPEHLIRFFPIRGTPVETLITADPPEHPQHHGRQGRPAAGGDRPVLDPRPGRGARLRAAAEGGARHVTAARWRS